MKEIELTQGYKALVDDDDYDKIGHLNWFAYKSSNNMYAARNITKEDNTQVMHGMHRVIMGLELHSDIQVDHKDRNTLNNQKSNLRLATHSQNMCNRIMPQSEKGSGYRGVSKTNHNRFRATVRFDGKRINLGVFATAVEAAKEYDKYAKIYHGEFAVLNFPND